MKSSTENIPVLLDDGTTIYVETTIAGEEEVAFREFRFDSITSVLSSLAKSVLIPLKELGPDKVEIEFGISIALESGELTALMVKGTGESNLKITLEWSGDSDDKSS